MRLKSAVIENWTVHEKTEIDFEPGNVYLFLGPNGAGKTSIFDAIKWNLRGKARGVLAKDSRERFLTRGSDGTLKVLTRFGIEGGTEFVVQRTPSGCSAREDDLVKMFGVRSLEALDVALAAGNFMSRPPEERARLVYTLLGEPITADDLKANGFDDRDVNVAILQRGVKSGHYAANLKRLEAQRAWKALTVSVPEDPGIKDSVESIDATIDALNRRVTDIEAEIEAAVAGSNTAAIMERYEKAKAAFDAIAADTEKANALLAKGKSLKATKEASEKDAASSDATVKRLDEILAKIEAEGRCFTCGSEVAKGSKTHTTLVEARDNLRLAAGQAREDAEKVTKDLMECGKEWRELDARLRPIRDEMALALSLKETAEKEGSGNGKDVAPLRAEKESRLKEIQSLRDNRLKVSLYEAAKKDAARTAKAIEDAKAREEHFAKMQAALEPDGILSKRLTAPLEKIRAAVAEMTPTIFDPERYKVEVRDDFEVLLNGDTVIMGSDGESFRVSALMAAAVVSLVGLKVLILDRLHELDPASRDGLLKTLLALATAKGMQILVANVNERYGMCRTCKKPRVALAGVCSDCGNAVTLMPPPKALEGKVRIFAVGNGKVAEIRA